jgi:hypothetical protein
MHKQNTLFCHKKEIKLHHKLLIICSLSEQSTI